MGMTVHAYLLFGHGFEQRALGAWRGAVDLVGQYDVGKDRTRTEFEGLVGSSPDRDTEDVGRQQVVGELDALPATAGDDGNRVGQRGLADAGKVLDQKVSTGQEGGEGQVDLCRLAENDPVDRGYRLTEPLAGAGPNRFGPTYWITHPTSLIQQRVELGRADEIVFAQAVDGVGREVHEAEVVTALEVGMVSFLVGHPRHGIDEGHGLVEPLELEPAENLLVVFGDLPSRHLGQQRVDAVAVQRLGSTLAGGAFLLFEVFAHFQAASFSFGG